MLSISDEHKEAIIRLINSIISEFPLITNLTNRSKVNNKLVKIIHWFQQSVDHNSGINLFIFYYIVINILVQ